MKNIFISLLILLEISCTTQNSKSKRLPKSTAIIEKWKKAVVHIEGVASSSDVSYYPQIAELLSNGLISKAKADTLFYLDRVSKRDRRYWGTAIFAKSDDRYYLLTARHVLLDKFTADREILRSIDHYKNKPNRNTLNDIQREFISGQEKIFSIIFRVPTYGEKVDSPVEQTVLMNLGAGIPDYRAYTFSDPLLDLAVISLNQKLDIKFRNFLLLKGHVPIDLKEISSETLSEGEDIMAVGFPASTANVKYIDFSTNNNREWMAYVQSVPIVSFGRVAMRHDSLHYFWGDVSVYPGNSGGPIVNKNKLIGIVSEQGTVALSKADGNVDSLRVRIPFAKTIKAKYFIELIKQQDLKDNELKSKLNR